jgi:hypothetical protein
MLPAIKHKAEDIFLREKGKNKEKRGKKKYEYGLPIRSDKV